MRRGTGLNANFFQRKGSLELPGYFRPTKEWDLLVVKDGKLIAAIEAKSIRNRVGPSQVIDYALKLYGKYVHFKT